MPKKKLENTEGWSVLDLYIYLLLNQEFLNDELVRMEASPRLYKEYPEYLDQFRDISRATQLIENTFDL